MNTQPTTTPHSVPDPHEHDDRDGEDVVGSEVDDSGYVIFDGKSPICLDEIVGHEAEESALTESTGGEGGARQWSTATVRIPPEGQHVIRRRT